MWEERSVEMKQVFLIFVLGHWTFVTLLILVGIGAVMWWVEDKLKGAHAQKLLMKLKDKVRQYNQKVKNTTIK